MSLYTLIPKPGFDRYTIQVGWSPHRTYVATLIDFTWDPVTEPERQPDVIHLGRVEAILDPAEVLAALEPYAEIPADLPARLRADQAKRPIRR